MSSAYSKSGTFVCSMLCQWAGAQETRKEHGQDGWPKLAKGIIHTIHRRSILVYKLGEVGQQPLFTGEGQTGNRSVDDEHGIVHHFLLLGLSNLSPFHCCYCYFYYLSFIMILSLNCYYCYYSYIAATTTNTTLFQLLNSSQILSFPFFPILCERVSDDLVLSCLLKLNLTPEIVNSQILQAVYALQHLF